ncbi:O-antigen ligase family protein [Pseudomonas putida]
MPFAQRATAVLTRYVMPLGWITLLTGLFWMGNRSGLHTLFYTLLAIPTVLVLVLRPAQFKSLTGNAFFIAFLLFSLYNALSQTWATGIHGLGDGFKRPFFIALLLFAVALMSELDEQRFIQCTRAAAVLGAVCAGASLVWFLVTPKPLDGRLTGYGALENPLLTAHVLGAFAAYWLAAWMLSPRLLSALPLACLLVLGAAILATGSRTPMVGLSAAILWLIVIGNRRRALMVAGLAVLLVVLLLLVDPQQVTQRGVSYRPAIWVESLRQISLKPWFGYGFGTGMVVQVDGLADPLVDPHNIELGVLYSGGIVGFALWVALYSAAARWCWTLRRDPMMLIASTWVVYGFAAGLTEGNAFFSRPKEHWFLIWIPLALVYGRALALRQHERRAVP